MPVEINELTTEVRQTPAEGQANALTPEMIRIITDKVVAMLLNDLRIEAERKRLTSSRSGWLRKERY